MADIANIDAVASGNVTVHTADPLFYTVVLPGVTYYATGIPDPIAPVISNVTPASGSAIQATTPVGLDATDDLNSFKRLLITAYFAGARVKEVVYDGEGFGPMYRNGYNTVTNITDGYRFTFLRDGGWPESPVITPFVIDTGGGENA